VVFVKVYASLINAKPFYFPRALVGPVADALNSNKNLSRVIKHKNASNTFAKTFNQFREVAYIKISTQLFGILPYESLQEFWPGHWLNGLQNLYNRIAGISARQVLPTCECWTTSAAAAAAAPAWRCTQQPR